MKTLINATLMVALLGATACTRADRFDDMNGTGMDANAGINQGIIPGSANDPRSPAYFNQTIGDRVLFAVDQSTLSPEAQRVLDGQAQWLMTNNDYLAVIEGHADEQGTRHYNLALGARRAAAVEAYLVSRGIPSDRLRTISYGKERPLAICSEESCYSQNRRAGTVLEAGSGV